MGLCEPLRRLGALNHMQQQSELRTQALDIVGGTAFGRYRKQSIEETFNMMVSDGALVDYPGYIKRLELDVDGQSRGLFRSTRFSHLVVVIANNVYIVNGDFAFSIVGQLETSEGPVFMAENLNKEIAIVDGQRMYVYNWDTNVFVQVTLDFVPVHIEAMDGYLIAAAKDTNLWRLSRLNNALLFPNDANSVGALQTKADDTVATIRLNRQLFVMGRVTMEAWRNVGTSPFPFTRDNSLSIDYGVVSVDSIANGFGMICWLAANERSGLGIKYTQGGPPIDLSTDGINFKLDQVTKPEQAFGFLFEEDRHIFYQITFPADNLTYVYDFIAQKFYTLTDENLNFHIAKEFAFFDNKLFFLSAKEGSLFEMGTEFTNYDGKIIPRIRKTKNFRVPSARRFVVAQSRTTLEQGNAANEQRVLLSLSKDGGESFGTVVSKVLNTLGNRPNILRFTQLGSQNDLVFQFRFESLDRFVVIHSEFDWYQ